MSLDPASVPRTIPELELACRSAWPAYCLSVSASAASRRTQVAGQGNSTPSDRNEHALVPSCEGAVHHSHHRPHPPQPTRTQRAALLAPHACQRPPPPLQLAPHPDPLRIPPVYKPCRFPPQALRRTQVPARVGLAVSPHGPYGRPCNAPRTARASCRRDPSPVG